MNRGKIAASCPAFGASAVMLAACTASTPPPPASCSAPQGSSSAAADLVAGDTAFAVALYQSAVSLEGASGNVALSPYSVSATMTMVDVGAAGETESQIRGVLHLPGSGASIAPAFAAVACEDETDGSSQGNRLSIANALWAQRGMPFESSFLSVLTSGYGAPVQWADFAADPSGSVGAINQWVSSETRSMIPDLLQPGDVTPTTRLVLVDAVYFDGAWDSGFDPGKTAPRAFVLSGGTTVDVPTMSGTVKLATGQVGGTAAGSTPVYEVPYKGGALVMDFLVPEGPLGAFEASLTPASLGAALASVGSGTNLVLYLPKFAFGTHFATLIPTLAAMGMTNVFDEHLADLSGMDGLRDLYVSAVVHEARVQVDEQGTISTAATAASISLATCTCPPGPETVAIDRPFVFLIRDTRNGSILFMGRVEDPRSG